MSELRLAQRMGRIQPSATLALTARAKALRAEGNDVIALTAGEPDFSTPDAIRASAVAALQAGGVVDRYTPASGLPEVRKAVADKFQRDNGLNYAPDQVMVNCGAKHSCFNLIAALVDEGDEVIIPAPYWVSYPEMVSFFGGRPVIIDTSSTGFVLTPEALKAALTPKTRLVLVNSPGNPTGAVWSREAQQGLADVLKGTDIAVLSDEIYEKLVYDGKHVSFASLSSDAFERTITVNGVAKAYAMTGWRIGYAGGPKHVIAAMGALQSHSTSNPATVSQLASLKALAEDPVELPGWKAKFVARRDVIVAGLNDVAGVSCTCPGGAFYVFPDFRGLLGKSHNGRVLTDDHALCDALLSAAHVAGVPGSEFGAPGFIRFSYAESDENIRKAVERIQKFASELT
ncbi:MAG: pyridoxal phosphate-dependent aminotransferase [Planctomycetes bacterium]|nr:pyridoxal phosphate-dependent aminotransferase [Planctomycetota bacterium]